MVAIVYYPFILHIITTVSWFENSNNVYLQAPQGDNGSGVSPITHIYLILFKSSKTA